jgi:geranylgeranyl reductase family protein
MYDVAVVGAGPAGSTVSRHLARSGLKVCIIDRSVFPRDKPCGGGFSLNILEEFPYLKTRSDDFLKGIAKVGVLHSPNQHIELQGRVNMAVTLRVDFDNVLLESAIEQGIDSFMGVRVKAIVRREDYNELLLTDGRTIRATIVVGSDGVSSLVARETSLHTKWEKDEITACRVVEIPAKSEEIRDRYTEDLHYHFFANLGGLPGYGWIFPKRNTINVGLGIVGSHAKGLPTRFDAFIRLLKRRDLLMKDADLSAVKGALVPTKGTVKKSYARNCLLVGDSAGMVNPLTGGGIGYAMRAARHASKVIVEALNNRSNGDADLGHYEELWQNDFGREFNAQLLAQRIFTSPFTDLLFEIGNRDNQIQEIVSESMSESSESKLDLKGLILRTLLVCFRSAFGESMGMSLKKSRRNK